MSKILIGNIQRFSLHDGPGIRTTVFMMGCSLHCPWCANPENMEMRPREYPDKDHVYGKYYDEDVLLQEILKDQIYFESGGGVTFSGGEPLLSAFTLQGIWQKLKLKGIHLAVETALFVPFKYLEAAFPLIDMYLIDVKILDPDTCQFVLGGDVEVYLCNFRWLVQQGATIALRFPVSIPETLNEKNVELILAFLREFRIQQIQIFAIHDLGRSKYKKLGKLFHEARSATEEELTKLKMRIEKQGTACEILQV